MSFKTQVAVFLSSETQKCCYVIHVVAMEISSKIKEPNNIIIIKYKPSAVHLLSTVYSYTDIEGIVTC